MQLPLTIFPGRAIVFFFLLLLRTSGFPNFSESKQENYILTRSYSPHVLNVRNFLRPFLSSFPIFSWISNTPQDLCNLKWIKLEKNATIMQTNGSRRTKSNEHDEHIWCDPQTHTYACGRTRFHTPLTLVHTLLRGTATFTLPDFNRPRWVRADAFSTSVCQVLHCLMFLFPGSFNMFWNIFEVKNVLGGWTTSHFRKSDMISQRPLPWGAASSCSSQCDLKPDPPCFPLARMAALAFFRCSGSPRRICWVSLLSFLLPHCRSGRRPGMPPGGWRGCRFGFSAAPFHWGPVRSPIQIHHPRKKSTSSSASTCTELQCCPPPEKKRLHGVWLIDIVTMHGHRWHFISCRLRNPDETFPVVQGVRPNLGINTLLRFGLGPSTFFSLWYFVFEKIKAKSAGKFGTLIQCHNTGHFDSSYQTPRNRGDSFVSFGYLDRVRLSGASQGVDARGQHHGVVVFRNLADCGDSCPNPKEGVQHLTEHFKATCDCNCWENVITGFTTQGTQKQQPQDRTDRSSWVLLEKTSNEKPKYNLITKRLSFYFSNGNQSVPLTGTWVVVNSPLKVGADVCELEHRLKCATLDASALHMWQETPVMSFTILVWKITSSYQFQGGNDIREGGGT